MAGATRHGDKADGYPLSKIQAGDASAAEAHWRAHMAVVGRVMLGQQASTVVELLHH
jgi:GntR family transcriptional regulator, transcriptional repressor for pyruvate dehydrogenase complex